MQELAFFVQLPRWRWHSTCDALSCFRFKALERLALWQILFDPRTQRPPPPGHGSLRPWRRAATGANLGVDRGFETLVLRGFGAGEVLRWWQNAWAAAVRAASFQDFSIPLNRFRSSSRNSPETRFLQSENRFDSLHFFATLGISPTRFLIHHKQVSSPFIFFVWWNPSRKTSLGYMYHQLCWIHLNTVTAIRSWLPISPASPILFLSTGLIEARAGVSESSFLCFWWVQHQW